jgi:hypothetical protein
VRLSTRTLIASSTIFITACVCIAIVSGDSGSIPSSAPTAGPVAFASLPRAGGQQEPSAAHVDAGQGQTCPAHRSHATSHPARTIVRGPDRVHDDAGDALAAGRQTFRFDTFGDEAFWGDTLKLHQAIEGATFGGVGPGVGPAPWTILSRPASVTASTPGQTAT